MVSLTPPQLAAYLTRLDVAESACGRATAATLRAVVEAHSLRCAFENFDIVLGRPVSLELPALVQKLVTQRRGGLCFEQNTLLAAALSALGFRVALRFARVWLRAAAYEPANPASPRLHMVLVVAAPDEPAAEFLVDVGFGGGGPAVPLALAPAHLAHTRGETYKLTRSEEAADDDWLLWALSGGEWRRLYSFEHAGRDAPRVHAVDFVPACHFVCTAPNTLFTTTRFATRITDSGRATLMQNELRLREHPEREGVPARLRVLPLPDAVAYAAAARAHLGMELSAAEAAHIFAANAAARG